MHIFHHLSKRCYPRATSKIIMMEKPIIVNMAITSFFLLLWLSGINSDTTTYIIAPAAKDRKNGSRSLTFNMRMAPMTPNIGSTIADN